MKKGAMHVDWAVSMGLFLVVILSVLVLFKPGGFPLYSKSYLVSSLQENILANVTHEVFLVPITFDTASQSASKARLKFTAQNAFPFCGTGNVYSVLDDQNNPVRFTLRGNCDTPGAMELDLDGVKPGKNSFKVVYAPLGALPSSSSSCNTEDPNNGCKVIPSFTVGVKEKQSGLNEPLVSSFLNTLDLRYDEVKKSYHFPQNKNFRVCLQDLTDCHPALTIPENSDVFARGFSGVVLTSEGKAGNRVDFIIQTW